MKEIIRYAKETEPEDLKDYIEGFVGFACIFIVLFMVAVIGG